MDYLASQALDFLTWLISLPKQGYVNLTRNSLAMWDDMTLLRTIRIIAILGAYLFLRPYLQKWGERTQKKQFEKEVEKSKQPQAVMAANDLRDGGGKKGKGKGKGKGVKFAEEVDEVEGKEEEWGGKAKSKQKEKVRKVLEKQEELRRVEQEDEEDKDIMQYLVDYEEGKDGW